MICGRNRYSRNWMISNETPVDRVKIISGSICYLTCLIVDNPYVFLRSLVTWLVLFERTWFKVDTLNVSINNKRNWLPLSCSLLLSFVYLIVTRFIGFITMTACVYDPVRKIYFQLELLCKRWTSIFCCSAEERRWIRRWEIPLSCVIRLIKIITYSGVIQSAC